jgi:hypothetical protein
MCRTIKCFSNFMCLLSSFSYHDCHSFFVGYVLDIKYVSCKHLKESTSQKIWKNLQFWVLFYPKQHSRFFDSGTDKPVISTNLSIISSGLPVNSGFHPCQIWNSNLNQNSTNIIDFCDIRRNRWGAVFGVLSILWSLTWTQGRDRKPRTFGWTWESIGRWRGARWSRVA